MLALLLLSQSARAECSPADLDPALDRAETAYIEADRGTLVQALKAARAATACASPSSVQAARLLRGDALVAALDNDWPTAEEDLRASVAAMPLLEMPPMLVRDQRLHLAWQRAQETPIQWSLASPALVNGTMTPLRPDTIVLGAKRRKSAKGPVRMVGLGLGIVAAGMYGAAWGTRFQYDQAVEDGRNAEARTHHRNTNALSIGSTAAAGVGLGMLGVSFAL
ncbi:MAG: hypothetical protein R3F61_13305 [Myxococcota bacterium]